MRIVFGMIMIGLLAAGALADSLSLRASVRVADSGSLTLADLCELSGEDAEAIGDVVVVEDIAAMLSRTKWPEVSITDIRRALKEAGRSSSRVEFSGSRCVLRRSFAPREQQSEVEIVRREPEAVVLEGEATVRSRVAQVVSARLKTPLDDLRFSFKERDRELLARGAGDGRIVVDPSSTSGTRQAVRVRVIQGERVDVDTRVSFEVVARRRVVVLNTELRRGEEIKAGMVAAEERWVDPSIERLIDSVDTVAGSIATRKVREGALITEDDAEPALMVKRRERVRVLCLAGGIGVEVWARAQGDARLGERVMLKREGSKELVSATVTGRRTAVMDLDLGGAVGTRVAKGGS